MANEQTIANLIVKLSAQTVELASGLKKAEGHVGAFKSAAMKLLGGISLAGLGVGLIKGIRDAQQYAAQMQVLAEKTNTNIEIISSLADASDDLGVSADQVANSFKFLGRSAYEATLNAGKQREAFQKLGVEYESTPGQVRPTLDILLDLAEALKKMTDSGDPRRNALAMEVLSRSFMDLIPLMTQGRKAIVDWMASSKDAGKAIDSYTGKAARQFSMDVSNLKDNIQGLALSIMGDLLPAMKSAVQGLIAWTTGIKDFYISFSLAMDAVKSLAIVAIPFVAAKLLSMVGSIGVVKQALDSIMLAKAIGGFSSLGLAVTNVGFIIKQFAVGTLGPMLLNPITWVVAALAVLTFAWLRLSKATEEAKVEHEKYIAAVSSMDLGTVQAEIVKYQAYLNTLAAFIKAKQAELEKETTAFGQAAIAASLDRAMKYQTDAIARLTALKKQAEKVKVVPPIDDNSAVLDKITAKTKEYDSALAGLVNPAAGARTALQAFEEELRKTAAFSPAMEAALGKMWAAFNRLQSATEKKALSEALDKREFASSVQAIEADMQRLDADYKQGLVGLDDYYQRRMTLIRNQVAAEVAFLEKQKVPGLPKSKAAEVDTAIAEKRAAGELKVTAEVDRQTEAYRRLRAEQREGDLADVLDADAAAVAELTIKYEDGLISVREYYAERRRLAAEASESEADKLEIEFEEANPEDEEAIFNRIAALRRKAQADSAALDRDEVLSTRAAVTKQYELRTAYLETVAAGQKYELDQMVAQGETELAALDQKHAGQLEAIRTFSEEKILLNGEYLEKTEALEQMKDAQDEARRAKKEQLEKDVLLKKLEYTKQGAQMVGEIFGNLYELSGKKVKAFFYLQKAAAIAEAIINVATGVTAALKLGPILGPVMAGIITSLGATQIAMIMSSTIKGMWKGGPVTGGSGTKDDVPAMLTRGEYVQPAPAVRYYGTEVMEAIRRRIIPRDVLKGFGFFPVARPQFAFAGGGSVSGGGGFTTNNFVDVGGVSVSNGDKVLESKMLRAMEETAIRVMKEHTR